MVGICPEHAKKYNKWYQCPDCLQINRKRYELTEKGKIYKKAKIKRQSANPSGKERTQRNQKIYKNTPEGKLKRSARDAVRWAKHTGKLTKLPCQVCGDPKSEAHHYLDYSKEHRLDVVFLCKEHHVLADHDPVFNETLKPDGLIV